MIKVLFVPVGKPPEVREIPNTLEAMQGLVGGYIEPIVLGDGVLAIVNEEGLVKGLSKNRRLPVGGALIVGDFFFVGSAGEDFASLPDDEIEWLRVQPELAVPR